MNPLISIFQVFRLTLYMCILNSFQMNPLIYLFQVFRLTLCMCILNSFRMNPLFTTFSGPQINHMYVCFRWFFELTLYLLFFSDHVLL